MKLTITSIELKSPFKFFALSSWALQIIRQLKSTPCVAFKKKGFWTRHYTMSLWQNDQDLQEFFTSGAHLQAMKVSKKIAREIRTITIDLDQIPDWKTAKELLKNGKVVGY